MYLEFDVNVRWDSVELDDFIDINLRRAVFPVIDKNTPGRKIVVVKFLKTFIQKPFFTVDNLLLKIVLSVADGFTVVVLFARETFRSQPKVVSFPICKRGHFVP